MGNNGFVWICPTLHEDGAGGFVQNLEVCTAYYDTIMLENDYLNLQTVPHADRQAISRLRNCVTALAQCKMMIYDTSIMHAYDASINAGFEVTILILKLNRIEC
jgi:exosome complex component RRP4